MFAANEHHPEHDGQEIVAAASRKTDIGLVGGIASPHLGNYAFPLHVAV